MFPLGHIGITLFISRYFSFSPLFIIIIIIIIGVLLPDIIDKSLFLAFDINTTRFIGHSLVFALIIGLTLYLATRDRIAAISLFTGFMGHLIEDSYSFIPWFYPLLDYDFPPIDHYAPLESYFTIFGFGTDLLGLALLAFIYKNDLIRRINNHSTKISKTT